MENKLGEIDGSMNESETARWVKESEMRKMKREKMLSCSFRRLGTCFMRNVSESAFKFLQFCNLPNTSPPQKCYFHSHLISFLVHKICVCVVAPIWCALLHCSQSLYWFFTQLWNSKGRSLQNCFFGPFSSASHLGNWLWRSFLSAKFLFENKRKKFIHRPSSHNDEVYKILFLSPTCDGLKSAYFMMFM